MATHLLRPTALVRDDQLVEGEDVAIGGDRPSEQRQVVQQTFVGEVPAGLKPWRDVITPHKDVASGKYMQAEFAADLSQVHRGEGSAEYLDPVEFFQRTYITEGLHELLQGALERLKPVEGDEPRTGDPVIELQTNFGGGKTHSMLALYHLFSGIDPNKLMGMESVLQGAGVTCAIKANRAVLVGTALSPGQADVKEDGTEVRTIWGEMAWQLGGKEAFDLVAESDALGTSPDKIVISELWKKYSPCLILIDEWVAYARQIIEKDDLPAGNFDAQATFAQVICEAAKMAPEALVVASIPQSRIEIGGEHGEHALDVLKNTFQRVATAWRPAAPNEGFEIVRRRLFEPISDENIPLRDAAADEFLKQYKKHY